MAKDYRILVVVNSEIGPGFKLSGVDVVSPSTAQEAEAIIEKEMQSDRYGIIILDENFLEKFSEKTKNEVLDSVVPLIVPVNLSRVSQESPEEYLENVVRRAVGFQIKVRA